MLRLNRIAAAQLNPIFSFWNHELDYALCHHPPRPKINGGMEVQVISYYRLNPLRELCDNGGCLLELPAPLLFLVLFYV
jgi:hypothetical protein